jgi:hypothetical protein
LITDRIGTIDSKFINYCAIEKVAIIIFVSNDYLPNKIENVDRPYLIFKTSEACANNIDYLIGMNKLFNYLDRRDKRFE